MREEEPFEEHAARHDDWFDAHPNAYASELQAVRSLLPPRGEGLEIGIGTGRFAVPLGIRHGVEPARAMRRVARAHGMEVAVAKALPYSAETFDFALMVTTVWFVDDIEAAFREAKRVLRPGGTLVVGLVDRVSPLGQAYEQRKADSVFYCGARFRSAAEVVAVMQAAGFEGLAFRQILFGDPALMEAPDPVLEGHGEGTFVVGRGMKR